MDVVSRKDIEAAASRINGRVRRTPVIQLEEAAFGIDAEIFLKLELFQHTGSFKPRGAFNRILSADVPPAGVITASGGNHGQAVAYASKVLGDRCRDLCSRGVTTTQGGPYSQTWEQS